MHQAQKKTPEQMVEAIFALNLDPIKFKLMDRVEGQGWTRVEADLHETGYRRFLALMAKYPDAPIVPDTNVDKFWHAHILDTMKYAEDCQNIFGYFVHHFPYFGMRGEEDAAQLESAAADTRRLYEKEFGEPPVLSASYCVRAADEGKPDDAQASAYCVRAGNEAETRPASAAYCVRAGEKAEAPSTPAAAYCVRAADKAEARPASAAYCVRAGESREAGATSAAYCVRAATPVTAQSGAAYCVRAASPAYYEAILAKGRPSLAA